MELKKIKDKIIFIYHYPDYSEYGDNYDWVRKKIKNQGYVNFKKDVFTFKTENIVHLEDFYDELEDDDEYKNLDLLEEDNGIPPPIFFEFANKLNDYYKIKSGILINDIDVYFCEEADFNLELFYAETNISIFKQIQSLVKEDIYIGGENIKSIPYTEFINLINEFPNTYEKNLYAQARISSVIKNYFETTIDSEINFQKYLDKKISKKGAKLKKIFQEYELKKYNTILEKLQGMLNDENSYSEDQWQNEILEIILLLYPKYILSFKTVYLKIDSSKKRFLDFMLVDGNGNIDVIEIKKPFENSIMTYTLYRNNYLPHKDLTGTIMQLEKYIFHLNRQGLSGENKLNEKYKKELPNGLEIKITNPKGFIIMGRDNNLSSDQKSDFEIVKRKYKNVIDILTYDDLLQRLQFTIEQIKK